MFYYSLYAGQIRHHERTRRFADNPCFQLFKTGRSRVKDFLAVDGQTARHRKGMLLQDDAELFLSTPEGHVAEKDVVVQLGLLGLQVNFGHRVRPGPRGRVDPQEVVRRVVLDVVLGTDKLLYILVY